MNGGKVKLKQARPFKSLHCHAKMIQPLWKGFEYKQHQTFGIEWMMQRESEAIPGGLLCDEMGLGKTIQMVGLIKSAFLRNTLLIAPLAVLEQWREIATKSHINCLMYKTGSWTPPVRTRISSPNLYLINYENVARHPELIQEIKWGRVICDEAHRLCSEGRAFKRIKQFEFPIHWLLTATPIVNGMGDIRALFKLIGIEYEESLLPQFVLARTMEELRAILPDLPAPAVEVTHRLDFDTEDEAEFYRGIQGLIVRRWKSLAADGAANALDRLKLILRLRQISLHPQVYIESRKRLLGPGKYERNDWIDGSTKFNAIQDLLLAEKTPKRWIVFCHFHKEMEMLQANLEANPSVEKVWCYSGNVKNEDRTKILKETHEPLNEKHQVLLVQLQSGGVGINLQHFSRIVFTGPWWTSALMNQAIGRAVRIGQKETVIVHHILLKEEEGLNIDKLIQEKAKLKGELCMKVLSAANHDIK